MIKSIVRTHDSEGNPTSYYLPMRSLHQEGMEFANNYIELGGQLTLWCTRCMREGIFHNPRFAAYTE